MGGRSVWNVGACVVLCRLVSGRITELQGAACLSCFLRAAAVDVCEVCPVLSLTGEIQEKLCTEYSRFCWAAAI